MKSTNQKSPQNKDQSTGVPDRKASATKRPNLSHETELGTEAGSNASFSESHEVTPPIAHEVPSIGNTKSDFENAGRHGRTSSRMIDHEPGL